VLFYRNVNQRRSLTCTNLTMHFAAVTNILTFALLMLYILLSPCAGPVNLQYVANVLLILKFEHIITKLVNFSTRQYPRPLQTLAHVH